CRLRRFCMQPLPPGHVLVIAAQHAPVANQWQAREIAGVDQWRPCRILSRCTDSLVGLFHETIAQWCFIMTLAIPDRQIQVVKGEINQFGRTVYVQPNGWVLAKERGQAWIEPETRERRQYADAHQ